jgi:hypothetical protein
MAVDQAYQTYLRAYAIAVSGSPLTIGDYRYHLDPDGSMMGNISVEVAAAIALGVRDAKQGGGTGVGVVPNSKADFEARLKTMLAQKP